MPFKLKTKMPKVLLPFFAAAIAPLSLSFSAYANSDVDFGVTIPETPLLEVTLLDPDSAAANGPITIDAVLSKGATGFNEKDVAINISTSNTWGYNLVMSVSNTALTSSNNNTIANLTQKSGGYTCTADTADNCDFTVNSWGFKIKSATSTQAATNYIPVPETITLGHSTTAASSEQAQIAFGSRINTSQAPGNYSTTINFLATANPDPTPTMQNITNAELATLLPNNGSTTTLKDSRDGNSYTVSKLDDGNYWMTQNLRLGKGNGQIISLNSTNSNLPAGRTFDLKASGMGSTQPNASGDCNVGNWHPNNTAEYYDVSHLCINTDDVETYGVYYNWYAATAGTGTYSLSSGDAVGSICPKGWRLPPNSGNKSYYNLLTTTLHLSGSAGSTTIQNSPYNFPLSGYTYGEGISSVGGYGNFWSSTALYEERAYTMYFNSSILEPHNNDGKGYGNSVRCVKDTTMQEVTTAQLNSWLPNNGDTMTLKDSRDGNSYTVSKLDDGNYWMTQNLRLGKGNGEVIVLNSTNSDLPSGRTFNLKASGMVAWNGSYAPDASGDCYVSDWGPNNTAEYYDVSHLCINTDDVETYGVYYNWYTATAGTGTYSLSSGDTVGSICPKGWRLPPNEGNKSYYNLLTTTLNLSGSAGSTTMKNSPYNFPLSGDTSGSGIFDYGSTYGKGVFWSSTAYDEESAYYLNFSSYGLTPQSSGGKGDSGRSVRCVFRS